MSQGKVKFDFKEDKYCVGYDYSKGGSCCGAEMLCDIWIGKEKTRSDGTSYFKLLSRTSDDFSKEVKLEAFKAFDNCIKNGDYKSNWSAGILMMLDYVKMRGNNRTGYFTREYCEWSGWNTDGIAVKNPNSSFYVQLWTRYVTKQKVSPHYVISDVVDVTNEMLSNESA